MNAVVSNSTNTSTQASVRDWIAELTDLTPQQIEDVLTQMEQHPPQETPIPQA